MDTVEKMQGLEKLGMITEDECHKICHGLALEYRDRHFLNINTEGLKNLANELSKKESIGPNMIKIVVNTLRDVSDRVINNNKDVILKKCEEEGIIHCNRDICAENDANGIDCKHCKVTEHNKKFDKWSFTSVNLSEELLYKLDDDDKTSLTDEENTVMDDIDGEVDEMLESADKIFLSAAAECTKCKSYIDRKAVDEIIEYLLNMIEQNLFVIHTLNEKKG